MKSIINDVIINEGVEKCMFRNENPNYKISLFSPIEAV